TLCLKIVLDRGVQIGFAHRYLNFAGRF
ncbi:MAG: hypothetical protein ACI92A_000798, partial [Candidatus Paceibacteria bacterium]